ncbi:MAG: branched-chain amino acid ABC transporter permease [Rhodospirillales bacterium]|nr:branched-chain amino acid ABC transporter permease [Rhodospirillales bacterium]
MFELILQTCVNALVASSFTALVAVGLVLIFGVMGIVNFAHGELYMVGAFAVWYLNAALGWPFLLAVAAAVLIVAGIGAVMERLLFRPMRANPLGGLIMSVGTLFILQVAALEFGGGTGRAKHVVPPWRGVVEVFGIEGVTVPIQRLAVILISVLLLGGLWFFLRHTKAGWALRACAQDPEAAALQGISIDRYALLAMVLGAGLAGAAGAVMSPLLPVEPSMGHAVIVTAFIVIIVGGIGSIEGAVLAAVIYTFFDTFVTTFVDGTIASILGLLIMMLVLVIKPTGLMGAREKV